MTHMTHKWPHVPTWPRAQVAQRWRICWHCWHVKTNSQQCQHGDGLRLDVVGTANIANMVCCLHELTIVSLLHELSMVAGDQVAGGEGGGGPSEGANGNGGFTHKFF